MAVKFEKVSDGEYMLDVTTYVCPHPQMYTKKALQKLNTGEVLTVLFDNPSSGESIISMCETTGDDLFDRSEDSGTFFWKIRKG
jgi:tRNA 2-thiouridine synthesizing protein A